MINLMIKSIAENTNKIDILANYIVKMNKRNCTMFLLITANIYIVSKAIKKNKEKIDALEAEIEGIKSNVA